MASLRGSYLYRLFPTGPTPAGAVLAFISVTLCRHSTRLSPASHCSFPRPVLRRHRAAGQSCPTSDIRKQKRLASIRDSSAPFNKFEVKKHSGTTQHSSDIQEY